MLVCTASSENNLLTYRPYGVTSRVFIIDIQELVSRTSTSKYLCSSEPFEGAKMAKKAAKTSTVISENLHKRLLDKPPPHIGAKETSSSKALATPFQRQIHAKY